MENNTNQNSDCGCNSNCCQPPKNNNLWMKIVFAVVLITAAGIITIKLLGKDNEQKASDNANVKQESVTDTTAKGCESTCNKKESSCCPKKTE